MLNINVTVISLQKTLNIGGVVRCFLLCNLCGPFGSTLASLVITSFALFLEDWNLYLCFCICSLFPNWLIDQSLESPPAYYISIFFSIFLHVYSVGVGLSVISKLPEIGSRIPNQTTSLDLTFVKCDARLWWWKFNSFPIIHGVSVFFSFIYQSCELASRLADVEKVSTSWKAVLVKSWSRWIRQ